MEVAMDMDMDWLVTFVSPDNPTAQISVVQAEEEAAQHTGLSLSVEVADVDAVSYARGYFFRGFFVILWAETCYNALSPSFYSILCRSSGRGFAEPLHTILGG